MTSPEQIRLLSLLLRAMINIFLFQTKSIYDKEFSMENQTVPRDNGPCPARMPAIGGDTSFSPLA